MVLKVDNLSKEFKIHIREGLVINSFKNVSFNVKEDTLLAITGESGVGKSTLLKCIYRTYKATSGKVIYKKSDGDDVDLVSLSDREVLGLRDKEIGYVSQFLHVIPRISAQELLKEKLLSNTINENRFSENKLNENEALNMAKALLKKVRISENLWDMYPSTFSGGEKQRLNILLALATKPRFLLLDEPTASLDQNSKDIIYEIILNAKNNGTTMIGVFHDKEAIEILSDETFKMTKVN